MNDAKRIGTPELSAALHQWTLSVLTGLGVIPINVSGRRDDAVGHADEAR